MHTKKNGNLQWVKQKPASIWFSGHKNTHETATNSQKRRFLVIHVPLRVPDSVWPVCPREPPPATFVHTCPGESTPPLTAKRNPVKHTGSDEKCAISSNHLRNDTSKINY